MARQLIRLPAAGRETLDPDRARPSGFDREATVRAWLALLEGRLDEALSLLASAVADRPAAPHDPWWFHLRLRAPDAESRLASFFEGARR